MASEPNPVKRKFVRTLLVAFVSVLVAFCLVASAKPDEFRVTRSTEIAAPTYVVFGLVNNLHQFNSWNPWAKIDPNAKSTFEGPQQGVGSILRWEGNHEVGQGSMTNVETKQNKFIQFRMDFLKPMEATHTAEFTFEPKGKGTVVTWTMYGHSNFVGKVMSLLFDCDKMVGDQFEKGLQNLKEQAEHKRK